MRREEATGGAERGGRGGRGMRGRGRVEGGGKRRMMATGMTEEQTTKMKWRRLKLNFLTNGIKDESNVFKF